MKQAMIFVIDGCAPEYLSEETTPNLFRMGSEAGGFIKTVQAAVPTVTNVNHACILSGLFPEDTGVTGNYFYNRKTQEQGFIEESRFMKAPTILDSYREHGGTTALLTVKGKVLSVFGAGADTGISVQDPDARLLKELQLDMPPAVGDPQSGEWILHAAFQCAALRNPDFLYCTTNDFVMHHYAPSTETAKKQMKLIDGWIGKIHGLDRTREIYVTADHGMNAKPLVVNLQHILDGAGFHTACIPPIKDRYVENHLYQEGGILYLYLNNPEETEAVLRFLEGVPAVERTLPAADAAKRYHLPEKPIGDYVVFAGPDCAFGEVPGESLTDPSIRTHGSLYERTVPLVAVSASAKQEDYQYSKDIVVNMRRSRGWQRLG